MRHKFIPYIPIIFAVFTTCFFTQNAYAESSPQKQYKTSEPLEKWSKNPDDLEVLRQLSSLYTTYMEFDSVIYYGNLLSLKSEEFKREEMNAVAHAYLSQAYLAKNNNDSARYYMEKGLSIAENNPDQENLENQWALITFYNALGIYSLNIEMDHHKAFELFHKGLEQASAYPDKRPQAVIASNLVRTCYVRKDPSGLQYTEDIYRYGVENDDQRMMFSGAYVSALMYHLIKDYEQAESFVRKALCHMEEHYRAEELYILYANLLLDLNREDEALKYYLLALEGIDNTDLTTATNICLSYGNYLMLKKRYTEAIEVLRKGLEISLEKEITIYRYLLYQKLSDSYLGLNDHKTALTYYTEYHIESDSIFNVERERSINELRIKYESEKQQKELQESRNIVLKQQRKQQAMVFALFFIITILIGIYLLYKRKNKLYIQIVKQNQESTKRQERLERRINELKTVQKQAEEEEIKPLSPEKYSVSSLTEQKSVKLFSELEDLMKSTKVYREKSLTKERLAEMLSTNRTYLSQIINEQTGLSYPHYINSFRIDEAKRILSDPEDERPLKAIASDLGFNSLTTFYNLFKNEVGLPPSRFREKALELSKK